MSPPMSRWFILTLRFLWLGGTHASDAHSNTTAYRTRDQGEGTAKGCY